MKMDIEMITKPLLAWFDNRKNLYGIAAFIGIIVLLAMDFSYYAEAIETVPFGSAVPVDTGGADTNDTEPIITNWTVVKEDVLSASGSVAIGRPNSDGDYQEHPFEVGDYAFTLYINLTGDGAVRPDFDLYLLGPSGKQVASAASAEASEHLVMDSKDLGRAGAGTFTAQVDPYSGVGLEYSITGTVIYHVPEECEGGVCPA